MTRKTISVYTCATVIFCAVLAAFYATAYPSHILWQEQNQIFLNLSLIHISEPTRH